MKVFCCRQSRICRDDIGEANCLPFSQVKTLLLGTLEKQLHVGAKLGKDRSVTVIGIIMHLSLTEKHDQSVIDVGIWW